MTMLSHSVRALGVAALLAFAAPLLAQTPAAPPLNAPPVSAPPVSAPPVATPPAPRDAPAGAPAAGPALAAPPAAGTPASNDNTQANPTQQRTPVGEQTQQPPKASAAGVNPATVTPPDGAPNPTKLSVQEQTLLNALKPGEMVSGRVSIPDEKAAGLIKPMGRDWQELRRETLPLIAAIAILGMLALLVLFFLIRGRIRLDSGFSGRLITRFGGVERFIHWMTASCFIVLALTGLNMAFGRALVEPWLGERAFSSMTAFGKMMHNYLAFPFMAGVALMFLAWVRDNIPSRVDLEWLARGGGLFGKHNHPPAPRFNAGQKGIFWVVVIGGAIMSFTGWHLLFPTAERMAEMPFQATIHGVCAALFIAVMLAHIYIGSLGMEGAFDAMGTGDVDINWAREHHSLWVEEEALRQRRHDEISGVHRMPAE